MQLVFLSDAYIEAAHPGAVADDVRAAGLSRNGGIEIQKAVYDEIIRKHYLVTKHVSHFDQSKNANTEPLSSTTGMARGGPGTQLHALLRDWLGIEPTPTCPCRSMAAKMDRLGREWCESDDGMAEILGVMRTEHAKRRAEGLTILPWTDFAAKQLVLLACRKSAASS